jgi:hypothetical protein
LLYAYYFFYFYLLFFFLSLFLFIYFIFIFIFLQTREHCFDLMEKALYENFVAAYQNDLDRARSADHEPRCCALDLEHEVFLSSKQAVMYKVSIMKIVSDLRKQTQEKQPHPCFAEAKERSQRVCETSGSGEGRRNSVSEEGGGSGYSGDAGSSSRTGLVNGKSPFVPASQVNVLSRVTSLVAQYGSDDSPSPAPSPKPYRSPPSPTSSASSPPPSPPSDAPSPEASPRSSPKPDASSQPSPPLDAPSSPSDAPSPNSNDSDCFTGCHDNEQTREEKEADNEDFLGSPIYEESVCTSEMEEAGSDTAQTSTSQPKNLSVLELFGDDSDDDGVGQLTIVTRDNSSSPQNNCVDNSLKVNHAAQDFAGNSATENSTTEDNNNSVSPFVKPPPPKIVYFWEREDYEPQPEKEEGDEEEEEKKEEGKVSKAASHKMNGEVKSKNHSHHHSKHHQHHHHSKSK